MAIYYPAGCDASVPAHLCDPCEALESAKIRDVAFVKTSVAFSDISNPTEWDTAINNGDVIVIPTVNGSFDGGAEVEAPGFGSQATQITGYNFSANFKDPNYKQNAAFYNALKNSRAYKFAYVTSSQIHISDNAVTVIPKNPVTENMTDYVLWDVTVKWQGSDLPEPNDIPPGIFGECFTVAS